MTERITTTATVPSELQLLDLMLGMMKTQSIHACTQLCLADLVDGEKTVPQIARETEPPTHPHALRRLFRALECMGIFSAIHEDVYAQTDLSRLLQQDGGMYYAGRMHGDPWQWRPWETFLYSLETGKPAFDHLYGQTMWDYFEHHKDEALNFNQAMKGLSTQVEGELAETYDFSDNQTIMDVGSGTGSMLATVLQRYPQAQGIFFDVPQVIQQAQENEQVLKVLSQARFESGDFFQAVPTGADVIMLRQIVKDWDDAQAIAILRNCACALNPGGKILVVEVVIASGMMMQKLVDLQLMVVLSGRERTEMEFRALIEKAGLRLERIIPVGRTSYSVFEVRK